MKILFPEFRFFGKKVKEVKYDTFYISDFI